MKKAASTLKNEKAEKACLLGQGTPRLCTDNC